MGVPGDPATGGILNFRLGRSWGKSVTRRDGLVRGKALVTPFEQMDPDAYAPEFVGATNTERKMCTNFPNAQCGSSVPPHKCTPSCFTKSPFVMVTCK